MLYAWGLEVCVIFSHIIKAPTYVFKSSDMGPVELAFLVSLCIQEYHM